MDPNHTEKTVSLNQRNISLLYGQRKNFFELKKDLLIQKNGLWSKEINLFTLKNIFLNQQKFLQFVIIRIENSVWKTVSLSQRNISSIYGQRKNFFELKKVLLTQRNVLWSKEIDLFTLKNIFLNQKNFLHF